MGNRQKPFSALFALVFIGSAFYGLISIALTNHAGLSIMGIRLTSEQATVFYWVGAVLAGFVSIIFLLLAFAAIAIRRSIELRTESLAFPRGGFSKQRIEVPYRSIKRAYLEETQGMRFLYIEHARGRLTVVPAMLQNEAALDELQANLRERMQG